MNWVFQRKRKTLTAAKKLADTEGGEVFCDGVSVYKGVEVLVNAEPVVAVEPKQSEVEEPNERYMVRYDLQGRCASSTRSIC